MNIFALSECPIEAAQSQCDKHVNKMTLEGVQILNGALYERDLDEHAFYGYTHKNHPCILWAAEKWENFAWLCRHVKWLAYEHWLRFKNNKLHKSYRKVKKCWFQGMPPPETGFGVIEVLTFAHVENAGEITDFPLAMPDDCKGNNYVKSYRKYYREYKQLEEWFTYEKSSSGKPNWLRR